MGREITTGAYWFYRRQFDNAGMNMRILLRDRIDGGLLQAAALRVMERFPFLKFTCEKSGDNTQYLLTENSRPFSVAERSGFVRFDDPVSNGYLWTLSCRENRLYLRLFHGLSDGLGLMSVARALLCAYFSALTGTPLPQAADPLSYADPFDYARPCSETFSFSVPEPFLTAPERDGASHRHLITLSLREVLDVSRQTEGSVSGILSLLLARALERRNRDPRKTVVVKCPLNLRPMLGCTETLQNCVSSVHYVYSEKLARLPFPQQASCFKGMLMIQSAEEFQMNRFLAWKQDVLRFNRSTTIEEKRAMLNTADGVFPMVSYLGRFSVGEYDRFLSGADVTLDLGGGIGTITLAIGDRLSMSLLTSEADRSFVRDLTGELDELGISYTIE